MTEPIEVVNIVFMRSGVLDFIESFRSDAREKAEKRFKDLARLHFSSCAQLSDEELDEHVENGYFDDGDSGRSLFISWSTVQE